MPGTVLSLALPSATRVASGTSLGSAVPPSLSDVPGVTVLYAHEKPDALQGLRLIGVDQGAADLFVTTYQFTVPLDGEATLVAGVQSGLQGAHATFVGGSGESAKKGGVEALSAVGETSTSYVEVIATTSGPTVVETLVIGPRGQETATKALRLEMQDSLLLR